MWTMCSEWSEQFVVVRLIPQRNVESNGNLINFHGTIDMKTWVHPTVVLVSSFFAIDHNLSANIYELYNSICEMGRVKINIEYQACHNFSLFTIQIMGVRQKVPLPVQNKHRQLSGRKKVYRFGSLISIYKSLISNDINSWKQMDIRPSSHLTSSRPPALYWQSSKTIRRISNL